MLDGMRRDAAFRVKGKDEETGEIIVLVQVEDWLVAAQKC